MTGDDALYRWAYRSRGNRDTRAADVEHRRTLLASALRAGHGSGARFELEVGSGPQATIELVARDAASARWVARVLAGAYEPQQWTRSHGGGSTPAGSGRRSVRRRASWPEPLRLPSDGSPLHDDLVLAFRTLPPGVLCRWQFEPVLTAAPAWWDFASSPPPVTPPPRPPRAPYRGSYEPPPRAPEDRPLFWRMQVSLEVSEPVGPTLGARAARVVESATRSRNGNGLRVASARRWSGLFDRGSELTEVELALVMPSVGCPVAGSSVPAGSLGGAPLPLGRSDDGTVIGPWVEPDQGRHLAVLGETGMGKSSLLVAVARHVAQNAGVIFFDPLGDTARALRDELPERAGPRVTWIGPRGPATLNALAGISVSSVEEEACHGRQLDDLVHSLRRVRSSRYADSGFWGPRLEEMLTRALRAAAAFPGGTLEDAHLLLASGGRGFRTVPASAADAVRDLGDRIRARPDDAEGARRLLYEVTRNPTLARLLCDRTPSLAPADLVAPERIVLVAGDATAAGETTARYFLSVALALVWSELLSRPGRAKTFVVLDEAQWFAHESLAEMLRLGRRLNVHVVLATQSVGSLPDGVAEAVWTNVADFVAFRGSPEEAREFARVAPGVPAEALLALPRGAAAAMIGKGNDVRWLRTSRLPARTAPARPTLAAAIGPAASAPRAGPAGAPEEPDEAGAVLAAIARRVAGSDSGEPVAVVLADLRGEADPSGRAVRAIGSRLVRTGTILRTTREASGTVWWVDPERWRELEPPMPRGPTSADANRAQP